MEGRSLSVVVFAALLLAQKPPEQPVEKASPSWSAEELKGLFQRIQMANQAATVDAKDNELANIAGFAYHVQGANMESRDAFAHRVLKTRVPDHPNVKNGQWLSALYRQFYDDASKRCAQIARIERSAKDRSYFEAMANETRAYADAIAKTLEISIVGLAGAWQPLPIVDHAEEPTMNCVQTTVKNGAVTIDGLERAHFTEADQPPPDIRRSAQGAVKEFVSAFKMFNVSAKMIGHYESLQRRSLGQICAVLPAAIPSIYLNELAKAGVEAEMDTVHLRVMTKASELRDLRVPIAKPKPRARGKTKSKAKTKAAAHDADIPEVSCSSPLPMQKCVERILAATSSASHGVLFYRPE
jgi:hypothetical protein